MMEIPDIEQIRRKMDQQWVGQRIRGVHVQRESWLTVSMEELAAGIVGRMLLFVERRGKALIFHLDDGRRMMLQVGFGGEMHAYPVHNEDVDTAKEDKPQEHLEDGVVSSHSERTAKAQLVLTLDNGSWEVSGARSLSLQWITAKELSEQMKKWGPDPLSRNLNAEVFKRLFEKRRTALKTALTNPAVISGITPVVADEICFRAGLLPNVRTEMLSDEDWEIVYEAMIAWLQDAIEYTETNPYQLNGRVGESCPVCGGKIEELLISGKTAAYCTTCQSEHAKRTEIMANH
ncbi:DNA-formamidopyrimidine glycosylase family protein [Paenibacillus marinisediminis]